MNQTRLLCFISDSKHLKTIQILVLRSLIFISFFSCLQPVVKHSNSCLIYYLPNDEKTLKSTIFQICAGSTEYILYLRFIHYLRFILIYSFQDILQLTALTQNPLTDPNKVLKFFRVAEADYLAFVLRTGQLYII